MGYGKSVPAKNIAEKKVSATPQTSTENEELDKITSSLTPKLAKNTTQGLGSLFSNKSSFSMGTSSKIKQFQAQKQSEMKMIDLL